MFKSFFLMSAALVIGATAFAAPNPFNLRIIRCDNHVNVFANAAPVDGMKVVIEFLDAQGASQRERGNIKIAADSSIIATSDSAYVRGEPRGTGYFIVKPAHDPYPGHCKSGL